MSDAELTFAELHAHTPDLTGPERLRFFYALSPSLRWSAWRNCAMAAGFASDRDFQEQCRPNPLDKTDALDWLAERQGGS